MKLTQSPIFKTLLKMSLPMSWGIFSVIGFNLADTYFIGNLGKTELAAISLTFPVVTFFASMAMGVATAGSSLISQALGRKDHEQVRRLTSDTLIFALLLVVMFVFIGLYSMESVFRLLGADDKLYPIIKDYMSIWFPGMVFVALPMAGNGAIRAQGDTKTASMIMMMAALTNVALDPLFIYGAGFIPAMGVKGAAWATVIARAFTMIASLSVLHFKYKMLDFTLPRFSVALESWKKLLFIGIPAAGSNMVTPIALSFTTAMIARISQESMAAFGVVSRIESFALVFILAVSSSMGPIVGQNFGAQKIERIKTALNSSMMIALAWSVCMAFLLSNTGELIMPLFNSDPEVIGVGAMYFQIVPISFGFLGIRLIACSSFNAMGKPFSSTILIIFNMVFLYI
ncbi:MAG: MATE family efflux transporter, partial [Bacteriovoracaceae bacterium]|nr:MATE family efflux transporter [Bacteriovoracaceae bacterium]